MKHETINYEYESIQKHLDSLQTNIKRIEYLLFIKKEIEIGIVEYNRIIEKLTCSSGIYNSNEEIQEVLNEILLKEKNDEIKYFINKHIILAKEDKIWGDSNPTPGFPVLGKMYSIIVDAKTRIDELNEISQKVNPLIKYYRDLDINIIAIMHDDNKILEEKNIDWVAYWFNNYFPRTPEEIQGVEKNIKNELIKWATEYLVNNPEVNKTVDQLADEKWETEFIRFKWQNEERKEKFAESRIDLLFDEVYDELLSSSELLLLSSEEKIKIRCSCKEEFDNRLLEFLRDKILGKPAPIVPIESTELMKEFVRDIIFVCEPKIIPKTNLDPKPVAVEDDLKGASHISGGAVSKEFSELAIENRELRGHIEIAHNTIKRTNKIKYAKLDYSKFSYSELQKIADATRKKNNSLNYAAIGKQIGVCDHTAKKICNYFEVK